MRVKDRRRADGNAMSANCTHNNVRWRRGGVDECLECGAERADDEGPWGPPTEHRPANYSHPVGPSYPAWKDFRPLDQDTVHILLRVIEDDASPVGDDAFDNISSALDASRRGIEVLAAADDDGWWFAYRLRVVIPAPAPEECGKYVSSGMEELRHMVSNFNYCHESFLERWTLADLIAIHRAWMASGWDIYPDNWTDAQLADALNHGIPPE